MHAPTLSHRWLFVKPQTAGSLGYPVGAIGKTSAESLRVSLQALRAAGIGPKGPLEFSRRAGIGEGTVSRARRGDGNTTLDSLDAMARAVKLQAWQLLVPGFDPTSPPRAITGTEQVEISPPQTVEVLDMKISLSALEVARAWEHLPPDRRVALKQKIIAESLHNRADFVPDEKLRHLKAPPPEAGTALRGLARRSTGQGGRSK